MSLSLNDILNIAVRFVQRDKIVKSNNVSLPNSAWPWTFADLEVAIVSGSGVTLNPGKYEAPDGSSISLPAGLIIDGNGASIDNCGLSFIGRNLKLNDFTLTGNPPYYGFYVGSSGGTDPTTDVVFNNVACDGIAIASQVDFECYAGSDSPLDGVTFNDCVSINSSSHGFMNGGYSPTTMAQVSNITYNNCKAINNGRYAQQNPYICGFDLCEVEAQFNNIVLNECFASYSYMDGFHTEETPVKTVYIYYSIAEYCGASGFGAQFTNPEDIVEFHNCAASWCGAGFSLEGSTTDTTGVGIAEDCTASENDYDYTIVGNGGQLINSTSTNPTNNLGGALHCYTATNVTVTNFSAINTLNGPSIFIDNVSDSTFNVDIVSCSFDNALYPYCIWVNDNCSNITLTGTIVTNASTPVLAGGTNCNVSELTVLQSINTAAIILTAPLEGANPQTVISDNGEFIGTVSWSPTVSGTFTAGTVYTAIITIAPDAGYSLTGVAANFFTVNGATSVANAAGSGVATVVFPANLLLADVANGGLDDSTTNVTAIGSLTGTTQMFIIPNASNFSTYQSDLGYFNVCCYEPTQDIAFSQIEQIPVEENIQYAVSAYVGAAGALSGVTVNVDWYESDGITKISTSTSSEAGIGYSWTKVSGTFTSPSNAAYGYCYITIPGVAYACNVWVTAWKFI